MEKAEALGLVQLWIKHPGRAQIKAGFAFVTRW